MADKKHITINGNGHADHTVSPVENDSYRHSLEELFSESVVAKVWATASPSLSKAEPPIRHPEYTIPGYLAYSHSSCDFWTSGFFPGCLALLYERRRRWQTHTRLSLQRQPHIENLRFACRWWSDALHVQAQRTDTHDLGFMIQPWAQPLWELDGNKHALNSMIAAAYSLISRFDSRVGAIRSWDTCVTRRYQFDDVKKDYLVIIDSMMNLNLIYYVARHVGDDRMAQVATTHASTLLKSHIRPDNSTWHVANFNQEDGTIKERLTNQGYADDSCWARGQAWGIAGYAQTFSWTRDERFLQASRRLADYFMSRLGPDSVPQWDFDAPMPGPKDTSAALVAAYGMLLLHRHLRDTTTIYLVHALRIIEGVTSTALSPKAHFRRKSDDSISVETSGEESIVLHATINNYEYAPRRWADHGLVYADYYFLLVGNTLLDMGLA